MKIPDNLTDGQVAAVILAICDQREKALSDFFELDPIAAVDDIRDRGLLAENKIDFIKVFEVIEFLSAIADELDIWVDIAENFLDAKSSYIEDGLRNGIMLTDESDERERLAFTLRERFGTIYIKMKAADIERLKDIFARKYTLKLVIDKYCRKYKVECYNEDGTLWKTYEFRPLYDGKRPQMIVKYIIAHEGEKCDRATLNRAMKIAVGKDGKAPTIDDEESLASSIFVRNKAAQAVFEIFCTMLPDEIVFNGNTVTGKTKSDLAELEKYSLSS